MKNDLFYKDIKEKFKLFCGQGLIMNLTFSEKMIDHTGFNPKYIHFKNDYEKEILKIIRNREYICQMKDGSPIQVCYSLSSGAVSKATFIFIPNLSYDYEPNNDLIEDKTKARKEPLYIRYDYDNNSDGKSIIHYKSHLHIGLNSEVRIPVYPVLLPSEFVKLVLFLFFPNEYDSYVDNTIIDYDLADEHLSLNVHSKDVLRKLCLHVHSLRNQI